MPIRKLCSVVVVSVFGVLLSGCDWSMSGYGPAHTNFNPGESKINIQNVGGVVDLWDAATTDGEIDFPPAVANGVVYVTVFSHVSFNQELWAFDAVTGARRWSRVLGDATGSSPAVVKGVVYVRSVDGLSALDAATGAKRWSANVGGSGSPTVASGVVYIAGVSSVLAFDAAGKTGCSGTPKKCVPLWTLAGGDEAAVANGVVYVGSWVAVENGIVYADGGLSAFDAAGKTGCSGTPKKCAPLWTADRGLSAFDAAGKTGCSGTPKKCVPLWTALDPPNGDFAVANGIVYIADSSDMLAFDGKTGCSGTPKSCAPLWSNPYANNLFGAPAVANGVVYITGRNFICCGDVDAYAAVCSGECREEAFLIPDDLVSSPPVISNGVIYVGGYHGTLHAFGLGS